MILRKILEKKLKDFIKNSGVHDPAHDLNHVLSVWKNAKLLVTKDTDMEILTAAVFLHDLGRFDKASMTGPHGKSSAKHARKILLDTGFPKKKIPAVLAAIKYHDNIHPLSKRKTIESKILFDADIVDALGYYGVARLIIHQTYLGFSLRQITKEGLISVEKGWYGIGTRKAKRLFRKRYLYALNFFRRLRKELT